MKKLFIAAVLSIFLIGCKDFEFRTYDVVFVNGEKQKIKACGKVSLIDGCLHSYGNMTDVVCGVRSYQLSTGESL